MGTKIIEQGSTAGGIAKVQYLDESGNVLYEVNDGDKIFKMVNGKISGLAGTGTRLVVADSAGNLSATTMAYSEDTYTPTLSAMGQVGEWGYSSSWGRYARVGKKITIFINIIWNAKPSAGTDIKISLPFSLDVKTIRGFLSEYSGITFVGKQLAITNLGSDAVNACIYQSASNSPAVSVRVSDVSSSGYLLGVIEGMLL